MQVLSVMLKKKKTTVLLELYHAIMMMIAFGMHINITLY